MAHSLVNLLELVNIMVFIKVEVNHRGLCRLLVVVVKHRLVAIIMNEQPMVAPMLTMVRVNTKLRFDSLVPFTRYFLNYDYNN